MSLQDWGEKIKWYWESGRSALKLEKFERYYTAAVVILVGLSSFGLGRLSVLEENRQPVIIEQDGGTAPPASEAGGAVAAISSPSTAAQGSASAGGASGVVFASKNGTKYYLPWCAGAAKIAEANKIWFNSEAEARAKGLQPTANCKGLK